MTEELENVIEEVSEIETPVTIEADDGIPSTAEMADVAEPTAAPAAVAPVAPVAAKRVQPKLPTAGGRAKVAPGTYLKKKGTGAPTQIKKPMAATGAKRPASVGAKKPASVGAKRPASVGAKKPASVGAKVNAPAAMPVSSGKCLWASTLVVWILLLSMATAAVLALTALGRGDMLAPVTKLVEKIPLGDTTALTEAEAIAVEAANSGQQLKSTLTSAQAFLGLGQTAPEAAPVDEPEPVEEADPMEESDPMEELEPAEEAYTPEDESYTPEESDPIEDLEPMEEIESSEDTII